MREIIILYLATALLACSGVLAEEPTRGASPIQFTLSGNLEVPLGPTAVERAIDFIGKQIDAKHAADAVPSPLWDLAIWRYLPRDPARTLNSPVASDDDPFLTPDYLTVSARQIDYQLKKSEKAGEKLLR